MARRRFEMFQYRQVLTRLRAGQTDRQISRARLMGRGKVGAFRALAQAQGWLDPHGALPDDAALAAAMGAELRARSTISTAEPHRARIERWMAEGIAGTVIHAALCREYGYSGSYSAVYRLICSIRRALSMAVQTRVNLAARSGAIISKVSQQGSYANEVREWIRALTCAQGKGFANGR